jgi:hypothetical protein
MKSKWNLLQRLLSLLVVSRLHSRGRGGRKERTLARLSLLVAAAAVVLPAVPAAADSSPSGQRFLGQSVLEPVYNDEQAGEIGYINQPLNAPQPVHANPVAWDPFYVVVYPVTSTVPETTTLQCQHLPVDNCPTNGPQIAAFAVNNEPAVYGAGVAGRDHLMDFPGGPQFNPNWEPIIVLFTPKAVTDGKINDHVLTDAKINELVSSGDATEFKRPDRAFICSSVSATVYNMATPPSPPS